MSQFPLMFLVFWWVCVCMCVWVGGFNPCFQGIYELLSFSVLRQGVRAAHPVLHQRRHWMSAGDIWPDQSDVPAMIPFRFLNSVIHSQRRPYSICHCLKHVWVQRPFHEQKITNQYEPREQTFCLTSVCVCSDSVTLLVFGTPPLVVAIRKVHSNVLQWCPCSGVFYGKDINLWLFNSLLWKTIVFDR